MEGEVGRNTPSLSKAAIQKSQFWNQRVNFIEDQVEGRD